MRTIVSVYIVLITIGLGLFFGSNFVVGQNSTNTTSTNTTRTNVTVCNGTVLIITLPTGGIGTSGTVFGGFGFSGFPFFWGFPPNRPMPYPPVGPPPRRHGGGW
ncbi:uncharacterized protein [Anabrus simplex]|uniref:uncharacterized protein n=1 Tax=Anabrus simplex TaxID=316456 RepID=UPI0035A3077F